MNRLKMKMVNIERSRRNREVCATSRVPLTPRGERTAGREKLHDDSVILSIYWDNWRLCLHISRSYLAAWVYTHGPNASPLPAAVPT